MGKSIVDIMMHLLANIFLMEQRNGPDSSSASDYGEALTTGLDGSIYISGYTNGDLDGKSIVDIMMHLLVNIFLMGRRIGPDFLEHPIMILLTQ